MDFPKEEFSNERCSVTWRQGQITGLDLKDTNNYPAFYTKSKRGLRQAWEAIRTAFTADTRMHDVLVILQDHKIKTHSWCMMD